MLAEQLHEKLSVVILHSLFELRREGVQRRAGANLQLLVRIKDARRIAFWHGSDMAPQPLVPLRLRPDEQQIHGQRVFNRQPRLRSLQGRPEERIRERAFHRPQTGGWDREDALAFLETPQRLDAAPGDGELIDRQAVQARGARSLEPRFHLRRLTRQSRHCFVQVR